MSITLLLLKQNLIMMLYLIVGYFLFKKKLVGTQGSADIGRMLLYVVMPCAIINSCLEEFSMEKLEGLAVSFLAALLALLLAMIVSRLTFSKECGIERFGTAFSNAGFIGIPLVQMTLGEDAVFYIASFVALLNILQWTYGVVVMSGDKSTISPKKIATNPIVIGFVIGLLLFVLPVSLPSALSGVIGTVASMNGPLAMIVLGTYLAQCNLRTLFTDKMVYRCVLIRLIVIPLLTILLLMPFPEKYETLKLTVLIAAAAPIGANVAIFAQLYHADYTQAVKEVCVTTIFSIVTLPLIIGLANFIL